MAFPAVQGQITGNTTGNTKPTTVTLPANIQAGEGLLVFFTIDGNQTPFSTTTGTSAGWVELLDLSYSGGNFSTCVYWNPSAIGGGSDALVLTYTIAERSTWISYRISGHANTTPAIASNEGDSTDSNPPSLSPTFTSKDGSWKNAVLQRKETI